MGDEWLATQALAALLRPAGEVHGADVLTGAHVLAVALLRVAGFLSE